MNTREAAKKWKVTTGTVAKWCRDGWVESALKDDKNQWSIYEDALSPLKFTVRQQKEYDQRLFLILKAISQRKTIPHIKLNCDQVELHEYFEELLENNFIKSRKISSEDIFKNYILTTMGVDSLSNRKGLKKVLKDISPIVKAVSEGVMDSITNPH